MVNIEHFEIPRQELENQLAWYNKKYGPYIKNKGLHNWKNLFRAPTMYEWVILAMLVLSLFIAWAYQRDIAVCQDYIKQQQSGFIPTPTVSTGEVEYNFQNPPRINIKEETDIKGGG